MEKNNNDLQPAMVLKANETCEGCLQKLGRIHELEAENKRLSELASTAPLSNHEVKRLREMLIMNTVFR